LVIRHHGTLQYYRRVAERSGVGGRLGGFVERLGATITELIQEAVEPEDLAALSERCGHDDPAQLAKLHDLRLIYAAYLDYLGGDRLDPSQFLQAARERLARCRWLRGARLWVDGFASFAGQETLTLVSLARLCAHVDITAMVEPALCAPRALTRTEIHTEPRASARANPAQAETWCSRERLFSRTYQTYRDLGRAFSNAGLELEAPVFLSGDSPLRFSANPSLARLERTLFAEGAPQGRGGQGPCRATAHRPTERIELVELPSRRVEADYAVSRICHWVRDSAFQCRYRDVAIIVRDLDLYHDLLTEALEARGIPFFIDRRRPIAHHPLIELLRSGTAMVADDFSLESVRMALKTGLFPISLTRADELENYLLAHGLSGLDTWQGVDWAFVSRRAYVEGERDAGAYEAQTLARINETRRAFLACMEPWRDSTIEAVAAAHRCGGRKLRRPVGGDAPTGAAWAAAIVEWLELLEIAKTLKGWASRSWRT
jgi:ATP-dependent helicase/nuclease subunit B